jgi:pyruvate/2-oxoacid:ferredoxin oxidoreductase beta subunit
MMITYGNVFVASINMGANPQHAVSAIIKVIIQVDITI